MNEYKNSFIALFDSGFGGISNLNFCLKLIPNENYVFYADSKNCPYGLKEKKDIIDIGKKIIKKFYKYNPKALIIACNTMSTSDLKALSDPFPDLKIIGTYPNFEHLLKPGTVLEEHYFKINRHKKHELTIKKLKILIIATTATCKSNYLKKKIEQYKNIIDVYTESADLIVEAVENNKLNEIYLDNYLKSLFIPYKDIDHLILGCTHFNFAKNIIRKNLSDKVNITSGSEASVNECYKYIRDRHLLNDNVTGAKDNGKYTIKIIDANLNHERKETFLRLLDFNKETHDIEFSTDLS